MDELDKAIKILKKLKDEDVKKKAEIKTKILDKLKNKEIDFYFLIKIDQSWKVYGLHDCSGYSEAFERLENILPDDELDDNHLLLHKDEVLEVLTAFESGNIIKQTENDNE